jgi:DNA-binding response OmpR family regulator
MACHFTAHRPLGSTRLNILAPVPRGGILEGPLIQIVLIEDDHLMREWLGRSLSSRGHTVRRFSRADDALAAVLADMPDVVVSDIRLPGMSGIEFGRMLRARGIDVPIVFMTADIDPRLDEDVRALGSRWMLRKPFHDVADLWCAVDEAAQSRPEDVDPSATSHALRTPLTAVRMALEGLLGERKLSPREQHLAEIATRNLDRLDAAVETHLSQLTPERETVE